ncbi:MAG: hypothetical protein KC635_05580, partial [Myxococcales bacterium]|nr:hypothetical protein [Myxococcales bacterium]
DGNLCTTDSCDHDTGCVNANNQVACDDGSACTAFDRCEQGACQGQTVDCDDHNACTLDSCNPALGCRHDLVVSNTCRPTITVTSPVRGATIQGASASSTVTVSGTVVSGAGSITSLKVNGVTTSVNSATGAFSRSITPTEGGNTLIIEATDALGTQRRHVSSFLWSTGYHKPTTPRNGIVAEGVGVWLGKNAIDDNSRSLPPNDLGTIFELVLKSFDISGLIPSPAAHNADAGGLVGKYDVYLTNFTYTPPTVALKPISGGLNMRATIRNGRMNVRAVKTCSAGFFDCWGPSPVTGYITFSSIVIDLDVSISASSGHDVVVGVPRAVVTINGVDTHIDGVLGPLLDFVLGFFIDDLVDNIEDAFASQIKPVLQPLVRDALRALAFTTSFDVPKVQGGGNIGVDVITDFQAITFNTSGGRFVLRAGGYHNPQVTPYSNLGIPDRRACGSGTQTLANPGVRDLELVLADDTLNQLLYAAWRGGLLEFPVPASWLQGASLPPGITNLTMTVSGMLAPTASDCGGGGLKAHIGDIKVVADMRVNNQPLTAIIWASIVANVQLSQAGGEITAKITSISSAETQVDVVQEGLIAAEGALQDIIEEQVIGGLLTSLAGTELGSIPLPDIDLSGALPSLPAGTGISIVPQTLYRSGGNTVVGGRLGQ